LSNSEWASAVVLVNKQDGSKRLCGDFRELNKLTRRDCYPLPNIELLLHRLQGKMVFSKLDCQDGFNHLKIRECDQPKTAIITPIGLFEYKAMPFGLKNAPSQFQRAMDNALKDVKKEAIVFIDDIIIASLSVEEHLIDLNKVFHCLKSSNVTLKAKKCKLFQDSVEILGHRITKDGIEAQPIKIQRILQQNKPQNLQELQSYLGAINYISKFIPNSASLISPLRSLLKRKTKFKWESKHDEAFDNIKKALGHLKPLAFLDNEAPKIVELESDAYTIAATLFQCDKNDIKKISIVDHKSRSLTASEERYCELEKEALALKFALSKFRPYLSSSEFIVKTGKPHFKTSVEKREISPRMTRIMLDIQDLNFKIELAKKISAFSTQNDIKKISKDLDLIQNVYIDGACRNNGKENAIASYGCYWGENHPLNTNGILEQNASNQRAELVAAIKAMEQAISSGLESVRIITDSNYLVKSITEWLPLWQKTNWVNSKGKVIANKDLHQELLKLTSKLNVIWKHVNGHAGVKGNEEAHALAAKALDTNMISLCCVTEQIDFKTEQEKDSYLINIKKVSNKASSRKKFSIVDGIIYRIKNSQRLLALPSHLKNDVLKIFHDDPILGGHYGVQKTFEKISNRYWWKGMRIDVENYIKSCHKCQIHKPNPGKPIGALQPQAIYNPMERIGIDFMGPLRETTQGNKYINVAVDYFTKLAVAKAIKEISSLEAAKFIVEDIVCKYGIPKEVLSDQGMQFRSKLFKELM
ncbi:RNA-directed DNA polymerase (Reverse transcriptase), partial [Dinothrombium tinctorium]